MAYFPMFLDLRKRKCLVVGGGRIALRKIQVLREFETGVTVVAKHICSEIRQLTEQDVQIQCVERGFLEEDLNGADLVVAATDDWETNHYIAGICRKRKLPVNAVDQPEDCDFIFPSYIRQGDLVGAFSSGGKSPVMTQYLKSVLAKEMTPFLGEVTEVLGSMREQASMEEKKRREFYQEILEWCLEKGCIPDKKKFRPG